MRANKAFSRWTFDFSPRCKVTGQGRATGPPELTSRCLRGGADGSHSPPTLRCGSFTPLDWEPGGWLHVDTRGRCPPSLQFRRHKTREEKTAGLCAPVPGTADLHRRPGAVTFLTKSVRQTMVQLHHHTSITTAENGEKESPNQSTCNPSVRSSGFLNSRTGR